MTNDAPHRHVEIEDHGRLVASADLEPVSDAHAVRVSVHVEAGHVSPGTGARLVDAVLDAPEVPHAERLEVTVPRGEAGVLDRVRERCEDVTTRPAGATVLV